MVAALVAAAFVATFSIDLGPVARHEAEVRASRYLDRPMHIGRLRAFLWPGQFELDDVVIEGVSSTDAPFLSAKKIRVSVPWTTIFHREVVVEVRMTDWNMTIEKWPDRKSSLPNLVHPRTGPKLVTTTVNFVYADRGAFTFIDHGVPWSVVAPNLSFDLVRAENLQAYVGTARFSKGTVRIQNYEPMATAFSTQFTIDGGLVRVHHIDLVTDGAHSSVTGQVDFAHWPEQTYNVRLGRRLLADARAVLRARPMAGERAGAIQRSIPPRQGRLRPRRQVQERAGDAAHARSDAAVSEPGRLAPMGARPFQRLQYDDRFLRRAGGPCLRAHA